MSHHTSEHICITATEVKSISTGGGTITTPKIDDSSSDCGVSTVDLEGFRMTCLVMYNLYGDPEVLVDMKRGITYELHPPVVKEVPQPIGDPTSCLPYGVN